MKFVTKYVVFGLLLWFALTLPGSAESAEEVYRLVPLEVGIQNASKTNGKLEMCGNYFAAGEKAGGKVIYFTFERKSFLDILPKFDFSKIRGVAVLTNKRFTSPMVLVLGNRRGVSLVFGMNATDYVAGLPCLAGANGTKI